MKLIRLFVLAGFTLALVVVTPGVASAHTAGGVTATDYKSTLDSFAPALPGLHLTVKELGNKLQLINSNATDVIIDGYAGEPYLRVGQHGVYVNLKSPAYFTNQTQNGANYVPASADPKAPPQWHKTSGGDLAVWHDHRIHWVATIDPPDVIAQPHVSHVVIPLWTVPMQYGSETLTASGHLTWVPPASPTPWYLIIGIAFAIGVALTFVPGSRKAISAGLLFLVIIDVVHTVGISLDVAGPATSRIARALGSVLPSAVAWLVGLYGVRRLFANADDAPWYGLFSACLIAVLGGFSDLQSLDKSQVPFVWSDGVGAAGLDRLLISVSLGLGAGLVVSMLIVLRRQRFVGTVALEQVSSAGGVIK